MQRVRLSSRQSPVLKLGDTQMTLSPKFRLPTSLLDRTSEFELSLSGDHPLIPGLPDDIALNCLLRFPVESHTSSRAVCKRWYHIFGSKDRFFARRKEMRIKDAWLFVLAFRTGKIQWQALDLTRLTWHMIPPMPSKDKMCPRGLSCVSVPETGTLFVCGGVVSDVDCPLNWVLKYEILKNRWTVMNHMNMARSFFASGVLDGNIYVAGGNSTNLFELDSAEVLDPVRGNWSRIANMNSQMASYDSAVLDGKFLVTEGWLWPFYVSPRGQVYDPRTDNWEKMAVGLTEGWTGSSVVVDGYLFVVSELERMKLKVYYPDIDSWEKVDGPPLPEQICKPFAVNAWDNKIYVVGRNLHLALGYISRLNDREGKKPVFCVRWDVVEAPGRFEDLTRGRFEDLTPSSSQVLLA